MYLRLASISLLLSLFFFQSQGDLFRKHYEAANAAHRAGNFAGAEAEYNAIVAEAYEQLGKIYSAQGKYSNSIEAFESANAIRRSPTSVLIDLVDCIFSCWSVHKRHRTVATRYRARAEKCNSSPHAG